MAKEPVFTRPAEVRDHLVRSLVLDLVGPAPDDEHEAESLPMAPQRWYLTGFLVPYEAKDQRHDPGSSEQVDAFDERGATDDATTPDRASGRKVLLPSSIGLSVLLEAGVSKIEAALDWGDYARRPGEDKEVIWTRTPKTARISVPIPRVAGPQAHLLPGTDGLKLVITARPASLRVGGHSLLPQGAQAVSVFVVNERPPRTEAEFADEAFVFQARLTLECTGFVARPDLRAQHGDWDERVAALQYRDVCEYAVGHGVSAKALVKGAHCERVHTDWAPCAWVARVEAYDVPGVTVNMEALAAAPDSSALQAMVQPLVGAYRAWIAKQTPAGLTTHEAETATELRQSAERVANRIESGIARLGEDRVFRAFIIAQRTMAAAGRRRDMQTRGVPLAETSEPCWRTFQLAFLLMNLDGMAEPTHADRELVDLLFFPTGGGKTEAYLGLAAFTLVLRRFTHQGIASAGVSVLMRYTLRLLTLDQLGRGAALICALELERQRDPAVLGEWPFEIGLWVGQAATPNRMGKKGDDQGAAREKIRRYKADSNSGAPIPLENCPWCGARFKPTSFNLEPNEEHPRTLSIRCVNDTCEFTRTNPLPIQAVDDSIYRRLPCFLIATVDKFASLPWTGQTGALFGRVSAHDRDGFYGPADRLGDPTPLAGPLPPPDLIIQDELHLISGPLGTMAGLYETAIDALCMRESSGRPVRPKIVASTATIRRANEQIRALFGRAEVEVFPPPGPDRSDSFFSRVVEGPGNSRLYVGLAAQGRSPKVLLLRTYLALLAAAQRAYMDAGGKQAGSANPADAYATLVGYFNSLRELGGSRRIVEDEVSARVRNYSRRKRVGEDRSMFADRVLHYEPRELTSRESTAKVSETKRRLGLPFAEEDRIDVALATNMISVGLDIVRLGLMVVFGQPKTGAEYIQATSRVGRDAKRPGLVVTLLNVHKPRDRSHYERFEAWHASFYRSVEATSVTPFAPRAIDRGLAAVTVALARLGVPALTPSLGALELQRQRRNTGFIAGILTERAARATGLHGDELSALQRQLEQRVSDLLDTWQKLAERQRETGAAFQYGTEERKVGKSLLCDPLARDVSDDERKFRAGRSLRDVEPSVGLWARTLDNVELLGGDE